jgi:hypothetical protein
VAAIQKYLVETDAVKKEAVHDDAELIKLFYTKVTGEKMAGGETFVDYLNRFWDWRHSCSRPQGAEKIHRTQTRHLLSEPYQTSHSALFQRHATLRCYDQNPGGVYAVNTPP